MSNSRVMTVLESLNLGLHHAFEQDESVVLLGEDILDPYGGAFKVTKGLSSSYPDRVLTTPISEAGIVGIAGGMALRGARPVVEIMFGDFLTLAADQLINHLAKFRYMYNDQVNVPVVIRTPMGGRRGYGPTHSQTLEKHYLGVPGLQVLAPFHIKGDDPLGAPGKLLSDMILTSQDPVLFIENKLQYLLPLVTPQTFPDHVCEQLPAGSSDQAPTYIIRIAHAPAARISLVTYGYMAHLAMQAQHRLAFENEIFVEIVVPTCLAPLQVEALVSSVRQTGNLITLEEAAAGWGFGTEVIAQFACKLGGDLRRSRCITAQPSHVPSGRQLEEATLPGVDEIIAAARELV